MRRAAVRAASLICCLIAAVLLVPASPPGPILAAGAAGGGGAAIAPASALFERLKSLEGEWIGKSTKGWTDDTTFRVIAGGSVVASTSFNAHPNETMMTMYHMDGGRVLLTHYCVAQNQPRLVASEIGEGGRTATFSFLDATGIPSRDAGHMDKATFSFQDADHFTSRWTWYQDGNQRWMEEIRYERKKRPAVDFPTGPG